MGRQSRWTLGLPFPATKQRADVEHPASRPAWCADRTRRTAEGTGGAQTSGGALPLSHGVEVLDVGPSIKGQCVQVPCRLLDQSWKTVRVRAGPGGLQPT